MARVSARQRATLWIGLAGLLVGGAFAAPRAMPEADPADLVTRQTARVAVLFWGLAVGSMLLGHGRKARWPWTLGCAAYLIHVAVAFDRVHAWSHSAAVQHVEEVSGFGPGLFVSYLFTLIWTVDAAGWWMDPAAYEGRSDWLDRGLHAFMALIVFNGTVVYETGFIRWAGLVLFAILAGLLVRRPRRKPGIIAES